MDSQTRKVLGTLANSADGVFSVDTDYGITYWSKAAQHLLGYSPQEVLGKLCYDVLHGKDVQGRTWCQQDCQVVLLLQEGKAIPNYDIMTTRKNGLPVWLNISIIPIPPGRGLPPIPIHIFREVTFSKTKELMADRVMALVGEANRTAAQREDRQLLEERRGILARREWAVLTLLAEGYSTRSVARKLGIREVTVRNYVQRILSKLGAHSRGEAIAWLYRHRHEAAGAGYPAGPLSPGESVGSDTCQADNKGNHRDAKPLPRDSEGAPQR